MGILGVFIVFLAIFLRIYYAQQHKKQKLETAESSDSKAWAIVTGENVLT